MSFTSEEICMASCDSCRKPFPETSNTFCGLAVLLFYAGWKVELYPTTCRCPDCQSKEGGHATRPVPD